MEKKFDVANPAGKPPRPTDADTWQIDVRKAILGPEESSNFMKLNNVPVDASFYSRYRDYIVEKTRNEKRATNLKCFDFNAYIVRRLELAGFEGPINKGLLGVSTKSGHEFLILFNTCGQYERILDCWSHLQTGAPAICTPADYGQLLPDDQSLRAHLDKGIRVSIRLKDGPCPQ